MKVAVWDTYVRKANGIIMHFDIIVPDTLTDEKRIFEIGRRYLTEKGLEKGRLSSKECAFCHVEQVRPDWEAAINEKGFFIYEMENCD